VPAARACRAAAIEFHNEVTRSASTEATSRRTSNARNNDTVDDGAQFAAQQLGG
jgi:hypothetical protein